MDPHRHRPGCGTPIRPEGSNRNSWKSKCPVVPGHPIPIPTGNADTPRHRRERGAMKKVCKVCSNRFETSTSATICSDECRAERLAERQSCLDAKFANLERVLDAEKIFWMDDRLIRSQHFYEALMAWECIWCGCPLTGQGHNLDRVDNSKPHNSWNVIPACGPCNQTRGNRYSFEEFALLREGLVAIRKLREARHQRN